MNLNFLFFSSALNGFAGKTSVGLDMMGGKEVLPFNVVMLIYLYGRSDPCS